MYRLGSDVVKRRCEALELRIAALRKRMRRPYYRLLSLRLRAELTELEEALAASTPPQAMDQWLAREALLERLEAKFETAVEAGPSLYRAEAKTVQRWMGTVAAIAGAAATVLILQVSTETSLDGLVATRPLSSTLCNDPVACEMDTRCIARVAPDGSHECKLKGDDDCRDEPGCRIAGRCFARQGYCVPWTEEHCAQSDACRLAGQCVIHQRRCMAVRDVDCRFAQVCVRGGRCKAKAGKCVAGPRAEAPQLEPLAQRLAEDELIDQLVLLEQ